ncbi:MAG: DNA polymerase IV [Lautropia sp.]|nr:DNA polymerase IV [Lautropia sp.]
MNLPSQRRIAHLDMDAFFASVALLQFPQLEGLPVVIGGSRMTAQQLLDEINRYQPGPDGPWPTPADIPPALFSRLGNYRGRGVSTTATYAAREFGISSGMGLTRAAQRCPHAILLPIDFERYRHFSRLFKDIILSEAPVMEDRGIDEVYIDFSALPGAADDGGLAVARRIQERIARETGLSCSIGVAPNKLIAKMASEFEKPNGISIVWPEDLQRRIWPLPARRINGIGPRTNARLEALGVRTIGELAACELSWLVQHFGAHQGQWLHDSAWGRDERPVANRTEPVSISRETTFERDLHAVHDRAELGRIFTRLAEQTAADLQRKGYAGRTIGIKLRYSDFRIVTRDQSIGEYLHDAASIRRVAGQCLKRVDLGKHLRLLGIRVSSLKRLDELDAENERGSGSRRGDEDLFEMLAPEPACPASPRPPARPVREDEPAPRRQRHEKIGEPHDGNPQAELPF